MNTQTQEALNMAMGALNKLARLGNGDAYGNSDGNCIARSALKAIDEALAQPAQEPVVYCKHGVPKGVCTLGEKDCNPAPSWQGLSDDEIQNVCGISKDGNYWDLCLDIARAIEQALKEKNK